MSGCACYTHISTLKHALWFDIIRTFRTRKYLNHNHSLILDRLHCYIRSDCRLTGIRDCIGIGIHRLIDVIYIHSHNLQGLIIYSENNPATSAIGKSYHCFHVFFAFLWYSNLVLNILWFAGKQRIFCHNTPSMYIYYSPNDIHFYIYHFLIGLYFLQNFL